MAKAAASLQDYQTAYDILVWTVLRDMQDKGLTTGIVTRERYQETVDAFGDYSLNLSEEPDGSIRFTIAPLTADQTPGALNIEKTYAETY